MKVVKFRLERFGREALEEFARGRGGSRSAAVRTASLYYLADREGSRPAWPVPRCPELGGDALELTVRFDHETLRAVEEEAERQEVSPATLIRHAVLYFLADVDSGRLGDSLRRALGESGSGPSA